ncbi:MAG TPA: helix-hairpin-helix domain-containing protein, partial [Candidatus Eisenbacteria bacterium]|nr:helix-hairpin-helix domain-containing protein [Candidatus Eisenbacteria bacterium]
MKVAIKNSQGGIALVMVMIVVIVLGILAGGFAYSMKVETKLARNASMNSELEWLGRSGIELGRYALAQQLSIPGENMYDGLNQKWAGGTGGAGVTNDFLADISLENYQLGRGSVSVKIEDLERKVNINAAILREDVPLLRQALALIGADASETTLIVNAILDWGDRDDSTHVGSSETESKYYLTLNPPYAAKNGPIDDLSELLLIHGITPQMYWGPKSIERLSATGPRPAIAGLRNPGETDYAIGLVDLFTSLSSGQLNINTANATTLQLIPGIDQNVAQAIISARAGPDGTDGTDDDTPFRNIGELARVPGMNANTAGQFSS